MRSDLLPAGLTVEVLGDYRSFLAIREEWEDLRARARFASVYFSHKWLRLSWELTWRRPLNRLRIVLVRDNGRLVMAGAFVLYLFNGWPAIGFLNSGTPQHDDVLYEPSAHTEAQAHAVLRALRRSVAFPRTLRAQRLREDCPLRAAAAAMGLVSRTRSRLLTVSLDLTPHTGFEAYLASLSQSTRQGHRRHLRQLEALEGFSYRRETGAARSETLAWLFDRKRQWARERGIAADWLHNRLIDRFTELLLRGEDAPECWVLSMRLGERIIAAKLCFVERETLNFSKITQDPEFDRYSPGFTANVLMIRDAYAAGLRRIDMGQGNFETKSRLSKQTHEVLVERIELK